MKLAVKYILIAVGVVFIVFTLFVGFKFYEFRKIEKIDKKTLINRLNKAFKIRESYSNDSLTNICILKSGRGKLNILKSCESENTNRIDLWPKDELKFDSISKYKINEFLGNKINDSLYSFTKTTGGKDVFVVDELNDSLTKIIAEFLINFYYEEKEVKYFEVGFGASKYKAIEYRMIK